MPPPIDLAALADRILETIPHDQIRAFLKAPAPAQLHKYRRDPVGFMEDVLGFFPTADQTKIALAARNGRVKVNSGHGVGKTALAAALTLWWFYSRPAAVVITTAPTLKDVRDLLWTEVRLLHSHAKLKLQDFFIGPAAPEMFENEEHWAKGYTANRGESFQGRHRESMMFIFDESEGVDPVYWETTGTMFQPDGDHVWLTIGNPTTTSSQSYLEDMATVPGGGAKWKLFTLSALNHPNIIAQLRGEKPLLPNAVTLGQVEQWLIDWADAVAPGDELATDVEWPPASGRFFRPGPSFQSRVMGIRPGAGVDTVWSTAAWNLACNPAIPAADRLYAAWAGRSGVNIGVDPAAFGDDDTAIHVRIGPVSVHHESHNGWGPDKTAGRLKELCSDWATFYNAQSRGSPRPQLVPEDVYCTIEGDGGFGVGVFSHRGGFRGWKLANAGAGCTLTANGRPQYANLRSQWWCETAKSAGNGGVDFSRLPGDVQAKLRVQLLAPYYWLAPGGSRVVEPKKDTKGRLKRSPDDADAVNLSHYYPKSFTPSAVFRDENDDYTEPSIIANRR